MQGNINILKASGEIRMIYGGSFSYEIIYSVVSLGSGVSFKLKIIEAIKSNIAKLMTRVSVEFWL